MSLHATAALSTLRIDHEGSAGTGFHFLSPGTVLTNHHVVAGAEANGKPITGTTSDGARMALKLEAFSPASKHDFAILSVQSGLPANRVALRPKVVKPVVLGAPVLFAGFPHGIPHFLVQQATVAGMVNEGAFYIDGSVNGGNSGGPILDTGDGTVIGIVTQRRFLGGADLDELGKAARALQAHCKSIAGRGGVQIMGIDFGGFSQLMAEGMQLIQQVLEANANTGIGIGFSIEFAAHKCTELGLR
jgi:S1-C subfamily serine protease